MYSMLWLNKTWYSRSFRNVKGGSQRYIQTLLIACTCPRTVNMAAAQFMPVLSLYNQTFFIKRTFQIPARVQPNSNNGLLSKFRRVETKGVKVP